MAFILLTFVLILISVTSASPAPVEVKWSEDTYGPDGPWHAVKVQIGSNNTSISLYPGGTWETWLISDDYYDCTPGDECYASKAGIYNTRTGSGSEMKPPAELDDFIQGLSVQGEAGVRYRDDMRIDNINITDASIALIDSQQIQYPGGKTVPFFAGCLSMGGPKSVHQSFKQPGGKPAINVSMPPGSLWENKYTPSNSYSMHIGSVNPFMPGSLWFGGYDKNRVVGDVLIMNGSPRNEGITLWDITIEGVGDGSPFSSKSKNDLLSKGNSSISNGLKVTVDGCSPYLTLPKSTCDNIAEHLPVDFNKDLGLYLWDTKSETYEKLINSPTALAFSFIAASNEEPITIRVPLMHLNLTLSEPIVDSPIPYFPCHVGGNGRYVLGRAFLQDAFIGANWHPSENRWWLAQAPGPKIQATSDVKPFQINQVAPKSSWNDWQASWKGVWNDEPAATDLTSKGDSGSKPKMSTGSQFGMGLGFGAAFGIICLGLGIFFLWRRWRNQPRPPEPAQKASMEDIYRTSFTKWPPSDLPPQEMHVPAHKLPPYEMPNDERRLYELYGESQQKRPLIPQRCELP